MIYFSVFLFIPIIVFMCFPKIRFLENITKSFIVLLVTFIYVFINNDFKILSVFKSITPKEGNIFILKILLIEVLLIVIVAYIEVIFSYIKNFLNINFSTTDYKEEKNKKLFIILSSIIAFSGIFIFMASKWLVNNFGDVSFEEYLFGMTGPSSGTPISFYIQIAFYFIIGVLSFILIFNLVRIFYNKSLHINFIDKFKISFRVFNNYIILLSSIIILIFGITTFYKDIKLSQYFSGDESTFIIDNYIEPKRHNIIFPEKKKNLIFIYMESLENTYLSKELGGDAKDNLMPNLTRLSTDPDSNKFRSDNLNGGAYQAPGTTNSISAMFSTQSGLPFKVPGPSNSYGEKNNFMPGAVTLGDILDVEGYNKQFLVGADGKFAGVTNMYKTHGNFEVLDYVEAKRQNKIPEDYKKWWGFEDKKLFNFAREYATNLSTKKEPFALILEADDTHFPDGFTDSSCSKDFKEPYANAIKCFDSQVANFIYWIKQQPFYDNTVIVLQGDHLSMEKNYFKTMTPGFRRTTFNLILNADTDATTNTEYKNRKYFTPDLFPTTLGALGVDIKGERLGLGTNMFSNKKTLYEEKGYGEVNYELGKKSKGFTEKFLEGRINY